MRSRSGSGCTEVTGLADRFYCRYALSCHRQQSHACLSPASLPWRAIPGHWSSPELCGRWQSSGDGQQLLTLLLEYAGRAGKGCAGSGPVLRDSQQRETVLVGLSLSCGLVSILWVEKWKRNPVPFHYSADCDLAGSKNWEREKRIAGTCFIA